MIEITIPERNYIFIGPLSGAKPSGLSIPFEDLKNYLESIGCECIFVDSNSDNYQSKFQMIFEIYRKILFSERDCHISLHGSLNDFKFIPPALLIRYLFNGGNFSLRKFAGSFYKDFEKLSYAYKIPIAWALRLSTVNFFETKKNFDKFKKFNNNTRLFPNTRIQSKFLASAPIQGEPFKILYLGRVIPEKGIRDLVEACKNFEDVNLSVIGRVENNNLEEYLRESHFEITRIIDLNREEVYQTISGHHCMVLPSYYPSEGIPGAVLEAFMCGVPVIVSNHNELPELCQDAGEICKVHDPHSIQQAIAKIQQSWPRYHKSARLQSRMYQSDIVFERYLSALGIIKDKDCLKDV